MRPSPERRPSPSRRTRMSNGMSPQQQYPGPHQRYSPPAHNGGPPQQQSRRPSQNGNGENGDGGPTPICRCRVLYLGSAVPHVTKDGLQGIQEPLKELYPEDGALGAKGIDSWLSVWSNGFLLENMDENRKKVTRFFPVESLHYCAAVRYVLVPGTSSGDKVARFLPLDSPFARNPNINHPPLFAAILRRTTGIKVLECHVFICKRETAANALVRCAFHAYADSTYAKHLEGGQSLYGTLGGMTPVPSATPLLVPASQMNGMRPETPREYQQSVIEMSEDSINSIEKVEEWKVIGNGNSSPRSPGYQNGVSTNNASPRENGNGSSPEDISVFNGDENHKVWAGKQIQEAQDAIYDYGSTMRSFRSSASGMSHRNRPRQMVMPSSPPPPPIPEEGSSSPNKDDRKSLDKKKKRRSKSRDVVDGSTEMLNAPHHVNGSALNGGGRSSSTLGGRQTNGESFMAGPSGPRVNGHPRGLPPPHPHHPVMMVPVSGKKAGTFSARQKGMPHPIPPFMMYGGPPPPFGMPYGPPPGYYGPPPHPQMVGRPGSRAMEEPIYMPHNARPLSPVASYQPGHFPHEAYYSQQQYATIDKANRYRKGKQSSKNGSKSSKDSKGQNGKNQQSSDSNAEDSEFGMYKKGHGNGHPFSYSIRNEQRSRSYGSLANMQFGPNGEALPPLPPGAEMIGQNGHHGPEGKKERELMQMMGDLDLTEEIIERSEVPPGLYPPGHPPNIMYGAPLPPPPHPHMVMMPTEPLAAGHHRRRRR